MNREAAKQFMQQYPSIKVEIIFNEFLRPDVAPRNMKVFLEALDYARTTPEHPRCGEISAAASKQADRDVTALLQQWGELG